MSGYNEEEVVHFFLWALHGKNVSAEANYYLFDFKFQSLALYSKPFEYEFATSLPDLNLHSCTLLQGSCPYIPIKLKKNAKPQILIPPLLFEVGSPRNEVPAIKDTAGLYHLVIKRSGEEQQVNPSDYRSYIGRDVCEILASDKLIDYNMLLNTYGANTHITYSMLFSEIDRQCKVFKLKPEETVVGIFSCQIKMRQFTTNYKNTNAKSLVPKARLPPSFTNTNILNNTSNRPRDNSIVSPLIVPINELKDWRPLAGLKHQGCGLNVLSYYDIIEQNAATEMAACLNITGTPIYDLVNYLNDDFTKKGINTDYLIVRYPIFIGLYLLLEFITNYNTDLNYAIIIKLYETEFQNGTNKFSQVGHTVSIAKSNNEVFFIDPQTLIKEQIHLNQMPLKDVAEEISKFMTTSYKKNFIDIIFSVKEQNDFDEKRPVLNYGIFEAGVLADSANFISKETNSNAKPAETFKPTSAVAQNSLSYNNYDVNDLMKVDKQYSNNSSISDYMDVDNEANSIMHEPLQSINKNSLSQSVGGKRMKTRKRKWNTIHLKTRKTNTFKRKHSVLNKENFATSINDKGEEEIVGDFVKMNKQIDKQFKVPSLIRSA